MTRSTALLLLLLAAAAPPSARAQVVVVRGGKVITVDGPEIDDGVVLVRDGRIAAVGSKAAVRVPYDATVIDATGKVVFPGYVLAHTSAGMDRPNESLPVAPFLDVADAVDPGSLAYEDALRDGITTLHVIQGHDTLIGGLARVLRPMGLTQDEMTVRAASALKLSVGGKRGWDRIRERARLREAFADLRDHVDAAAERRHDEEEKAAGRTSKARPEQAREAGRALLRPEDLDEQRRNLWLLTQGHLDAVIYCAAARDVDYAVAMALEMGFLERSTFVLGGDAYKAAALLAEAGRPVVVDGLLHREEDPVTGEERETFVPKALLDAGLEPALLVEPDASFAERFLWYQAARCVREGLPRQAALKAVTLWPARAIGMLDRVGSITPGKDANLLLLSGDPLSARSHVEAVLLEGNLVYERGKDHRLRRLVTGQAAAPAAPAPPAEDARPRRGERGERPRAPAPAPAPGGREGGR
ncbi:MAG: amidohydrolase family protein [Planctomycetes bacterium]|nr:amidohydrolase family protein [Planctomycetota bacterium]